MTVNYINLYPESALLYAFSISLSCIFAFTATKSRRPLLFVFLSILVFVLVAGLRAPSVGTDTQGYLVTFEALRYTMQWRVISITEPGFLLLSRGLMVVVGNPQACMFIIAAITNILIIGRFWELRDKLSFPSMVLAYGILFFLASSLSGVRQILAVAIIFWGTRYLYKKAYIPYLLIVGLATTIHYSAVVALVPLLIDFLYYKPVKKNDPIVTMRSIFMIFFPIAAFLTVLLAGNILELSGYFRWISPEEVSDNTLPSTMAWLWLLLILFYAVDYMLGRKQLSSSASSTRQTVLLNAFAYIVLFWFVGTIFPVVSRLGWYFLPMTLFLFAQEPCSVEIGRGRVFPVLLKAVILGYTFYSIVSSGGNGQMPYIPFWTTL